MLQKGNFQTFLRHAVPVHQWVRNRCVLRSRSISELFKVDLPGKRIESGGQGLNNELQRLADFAGGLPDSELIKEMGDAQTNKRVKSKFHRETGVDSGRQPGYGKRTP